MEEKFIARRPWDVNLIILVFTGNVMSPNLFNLLRYYKIKLLCLVIAKILLNYKETILFIRYDEQWLYIE